MAGPTRSSSQVSGRTTFLPHSTGDARNSRNHLEVWSLLFPDTLLGKIVDHSNEEIRRRMVAMTETTMRSRDREVTLGESKALFGLFYAAGLISSSKYKPEKLWSENSGMIQCLGSMSLKRYNFHFPCLWFDDKNTRNCHCNFRIYIESLPGYYVCILSESIHGR